MSIPTPWIDRSQFGKSKGAGCDEGQKFEGKYDSKLEFPKGWVEGGSNQKRTLDPLGAWGVMDIFHNNKTRKCGGKYGVAISTSHFQ